MTTRKRAADAFRKALGPLSFGAFLRAARASLDLTQTEMAQRLGVTKSSICDIEKGRQPVSPALASEIATRAGLSKKLAVKLALQDSLKKAGIDYEVTLRTVA